MAGACVSSNFQEIFQDFQEILPGIFPEIYMFFQISKDTSQEIRKMGGNIILLRELKLTFNMESLLIEGIQITHQKQAQETPT